MDISGFIHKNWGLKIIYFYSVLCNPIVCSQALYRKLVKKIDEFV